MKENLSKLVTLALLTLVTGASVFTVLQISNAANSVPEFGAGKHGGAVAGHGEAGGHGEAKAEGHGGGAEHGAPAGGHGEAKAEEHGGGGHGEAKAEGHGGGAEHGAPAPGGTDRKTASVGLVSVDEIFVNVGTAGLVKSLGLKLELELFEESARKSLETKNSGIKDSIIEVSREQDVSRLSTVAGKLYFKECLVARLNAFFKEPVIKDIHFSAFYLQ